MAVLVVKRAADYVEAGLSLGAFKQNLFSRPKQNSELAISYHNLLLSVSFTSGSKIKTIKNKPESQP